MTKESNTTYFTRLRGLATVVWNPAKSCSLAHFSRQGLFATSEPKIITVLEAMGYRKVTAAQIVQAGLPVPHEDDTPDAPMPGAGYGPPAGGEGGMQPGTSTAGQPDRENDVHVKALFEPDPTLPEPPGDKGRKLVT